MKSALFLRFLLVPAVFVMVWPLPSTAAAQTQTVGLFLNDTASYSGYTFWEPMQDTTAYLIDPYGRVVHTWPSSHVPGADAYLLPNGHCLKSVKVTTTGGFLQEFDWDGNLVWNWQDEDPSFHQHHDIQPLPNGNVLILANEFKTAAEVLAAGRDSLNLGSDTVSSIEILEVHPSGPTTGDIVWEWHLWDHLVQDADSSKANYGVVADHPELLDVNIGGHYKDWLHANAVSYNPDLDQIIWSSRTVSEFYVIDHSTTTAEAAGHTGGAHGHGGDFLYRWGNPQNYRAGDSTDRKLYFQHDADWIADGLPGAGHMMVFNNGGDNRPYSTVDEIAPPVDGNGDYSWPSPGQAFGPSDPVWTWVDNPPDSFYAWFISGAQRLPNGNTLIDSGPKGVFFEVTPAGDVVWRYVNPAGGNGIADQGIAPTASACFRANRFFADYPGFVGHDLTPMAALEGNPVAISGSGYSPTAPVPSDTAFVITAQMTVAAGAVVNPAVYVSTGSGYQPYAMADDGAHGDGTAGDKIFGAVIPRPATSTTVTYYLEAYNSADSVAYDPANPPVTVYRFQSGYPCGNIDGLAGGGPTNVSDLTYLVAFLFKNGPPPPDENAANVDGLSGGSLVNVADLTYLVAYLFKGGPAPVC